MNDSTTSSSLAEQLSHLFGSYKAEWLKEQMYELFTEPAYFPELTTSRPCMLLGGRGTGKTTVLRCMSYEGQFVRRGRKPSDISGWPYFGLYYRVNTNRVAAFSGAEIPDQTWQRVFGHYINLVCCDLIVRFLEWFYLYCPTLPSITADDCNRVVASLNLDPADDLSKLAHRISAAQSRFEAFVNNIVDEKGLQLSLQGAPLDLLMESLQKLPQFKGKNFFFLIDEYENFSDAQQQVVNTLIKHAGQLYSFKIGVKELGWRCRTTLNSNEQLISPADYVRIRIADKFEGDRFTAFAERVCNERIAKLGATTERSLGVKLLFPKMTDEEEAELLDAQGGGVAAEAAKELEKIALSDDDFENLSLLEKYFIVFWARGHDLSVPSQWKDYLKNRDKWEERYHNYKHSLLYTLKRGRSGIQKYFAGWEVLAHLAAGNIRYLLELVDQILLRHVQAGHNLNDPIPFETQTLGAQYVGKKNLSELEGLSVHGAQLTKLLLGLGRIFQAMASEAEGHMAEVNHFHLSDPLPTDSPHITDQVTTLLTMAVMHLALLRFPGNKLSDETDTRDYDYMVHPIFSAFFVFSYRKKRKIILSGSQLVGLVTEPRKTIREILATTSRGSEEDLPDQLQLFRAFYGSD